MEISLLAKSSSHPKEPYQVTFLIEDDLLRVFCNCPAGQFGQLCKHKISFASNDSEMLFDAKQRNELRQVQEWVQSSDLPNLIGGVHQIEKELEELKKRLKSVKAKVGRVMAEGVK